MNTAALNDKRSLFIIEENTSLLYSNLQKKTKESSLNKRKTSQLTVNNLDPVFVATPSTIFFVLN